MAKLDLEPIEEPRVNLDLEEIPQAPQSFISQAAQFGKDILGGLYKGAAEQATQLANLPAPFRAALATTFPSALMPKPLQLPTSIPVGRPGEIGYEIGEYGPAVASLIGGGAAAIPKIARGAGALSEAIPGLRQLTNRAVPYAEKRAVDYSKQMAADYYDTPNFSNKIGEEANEIANVLSNKYSAFKNESKDLYNQISPEEWGTKIDRPEALNFVKEIKKFGKGYLGESSKNALNKFIKSPTALNAHQAQSKIGSQLRELYKMDPSKRPSFDDLQEMNSLRSNLRETIGEAVGSKYKDASSHYRDYVAPYTEDPVVSNILKGKVPSGESLARRFSQGETLSGEDAIAPNALKKIAGHLSDNEKEKFILPFIRGSAGNPFMNVSNEVNPEVMRKGLESLKVRGLEKFMTPQMKNDLKTLNALTKEIARQEKLTKYVRRGALATGGVLGTKEASNYF